MFQQLDSNFNKIKFKQRKYLSLIIFSLTNVQFDSKSLSKILTASPQLKFYRLDEFCRLCSLSLLQRAFTVFWLLRRQSVVSTFSSDFDEKRGLNRGVEPLQMTRFSTCVKSNVPQFLHNCVLFQEKPMNFFLGFDEFQESTTSQFISLMVLLWL